MKDDELIEKMKSDVLPRIRDLMSLRHKEALDTPEFAQMCADIGVVAETVELPLNEEDWEVVKGALSGSLTTIAIQLLWAVASMSDEGIFISNDRSLAVAVTTINLRELVHDTGMRPDDVYFVLQQMAESFKEVVRAHTSIMVLIDRKPVDLRAE